MEKGHQLEILPDNKITEIIFRAVQATKRENSDLVSEIKSSVKVLDEHYKQIDLRLVEIREQTIRTNGRVSRLENWRSWVTGGLSIMGFLLIFVIIPLIVYAVKK